jgi:enoyl-[acyl-carrier-protein] reductase (NADH)
VEALDLVGRNGLVVGIANEHSLAWAAAQDFRNAGAELGITYRNDKAKSLAMPTISAFLPLRATLISEDRNVHDALSRPAFERVDQSTDNVCSAIIRSSSFGTT